MKKTFIILFLSIFIFYPIITKASLGCLDYGYGAYETLSGNCTCKTGYTWGTNSIGQPYCITMLSFCQNKLGTFSTYNSLTGNCECWNGYFIGEDLFGEPECISGNSWCKDKLGYNSNYSSLKDTCVCNNGYELSQKTTGGLTCLSCFQKYGLHSSYDYISKQCECDNGYTMADGECIKKQNNAYFYLKELDTENQQAIIRSDYDYQYYLIDYGSGCYNSSFEDYLYDNIVVNLGTDFEVDYLDLIILYNHDEVCYITNVDTVDSDFTFEKEKEQNYIVNLNILPLNNIDSDQNISTDGVLDKNIDINNIDDGAKYEENTDKNNKNVNIENTLTKNSDENLTSDKTVSERFNENTKNIENELDKKNGNLRKLDNIIPGIVILILAGFGFLFYRFVKTD